MLDAKDLELIVKELEGSENEDIINIVKRLNILIAQDKANSEYREKMEEYSKQLKELIEPLEK